MSKLAKEESLSGNWFDSRFNCKLFISTVQVGKLLVLLVLLSVNTAMAQDKPAESGKTSSVEKNIERMKELIGGNAKDANETAKVTEDAGKEDPPRPKSLSPTVSDPVTLEKYQTSLQAYYDYRTSGLNHRSRVFEWQLFSAKLIFGVVVMLVFAGIIFAWLQFKAGMDKKHSEGTAGEAVTQIEASAEGIKVSSPVLGVIILVISLLFFYLYLVHVYPIEEIF